MRESAFRVRKEDKESEKEMVFSNTPTLPLPLGGRSLSSQAADRCTQLAFKSHFHAGMLKYGDLDVCCRALPSNINQSVVRVFACKPTTPAQQPQPRRQRRRRRLKTEDAKSEAYRSEHYWDPHLERQVRRIKEQGMHLNHDVERLKLQRENKFELILELAEEANNYLINHPEESIVKKPVLKVISDMVNQSGAGKVADAYLDATFEFLEDLGEFTLF